MVEKDSRFLKEIEIWIAQQKEYYSDLMLLYDRVGNDIGLNQISEKYKNILEFEKKINDLKEEQ